MEPGEYDHQAIEAATRALWEAHDVYRFDRDGHGPVFSVDTPPPYVSAAHLHVGHAMSYSQPDFIVRYRRMRGERVFYPIGFDDNGLPTERYVEQAYGVRAADMPRAEFVALCLAETQRTAGRYEDLWRRLGLSVDWSLRYSTIDARCQRTAQASFVALHEAGYLRRAQDPILWCPLDQTSLAQADTEDLERTSRLHTIAFGAGLQIATTRPELLPACVALYHHPADPRYAGLTTARVPLFGHEVPVLADEDVDPEYGTGLMMVCTFGDSEDVLRWRRDHLALRLVLGPDGRLGELAGPFAGLSGDPGAFGRGQGAGRGGAAGGQRPGAAGGRGARAVPDPGGVPDQAAVVHRGAGERRPVPGPRGRAGVDPAVHAAPARGLDRRAEVGLEHHPAAPVRGAVPGLVLRLLRSAGAGPGRGPAGGSADGPPPAAACPSCGAAEFAGDPDVMDTWMTSSLSPQINDGWATGGTDPALAPMSMRVQAFEIIRTWLFYSVVQSELLFGRVPWRTALISGWGLSEQGKKLSKRDLDRSAGPDGFNRYVPDDVMAKYGADALRLWATRGRIGTDLRYTEKDVRTGRKFTVKLWNVGRFVSMNLGGFDPSAAAPPPGERDIVDRWVLSHLAETVAEVTAAFEAHDYMQAHQAASRMFWSVYCDRYIEMIKDRLGDSADSDGGGAAAMARAAAIARGLDSTDPEYRGRESARWTLWESFRVLLGLFAPFAPFLTEHLYQRFYRAHEDAVSLHLTAWPAVDPRWASDRSAVDQLAVILDATRVLRSGLRLGNSARLSQLVVQAHDEAARALLDQIAEPLRVAARADAVVRGPAEHPSGVPGITVGIVL